MNANSVVAELEPVEARISKNENEGIEARWEFGQVLVRQRVGKQLPKGLRARITDQFGLEASEITRRMQLAERFATREALAELCAMPGMSWRRIIREELTSAPRPADGVAWGERAKWRLDKLLQEAGQSDDRHDVLVERLQDALRTLADRLTEVAA